MDSNASIAQNAKSTESRNEDSESIQQNDHKQNINVVIEKVTKPSEELRFSPSALSDLLNTFLLDATVPESQIDKALVLLRLSPTALVDFDESFIVAILLSAIEKSDEHTASKYLLLLSSLLSFSVSPRSLRFIIDYIVSPGRVWRPYSYELIHQLKLASSFPNNMSFFVFPGEAKSTLIIPPISKFPYQNGWTFQSWLYLNPSLCKLSEIKPRYLFSFQTDKGLGYTAHFLGTLFIVTAIRAKEKGVQHCVPTEFQPCRWYMLTLVFVYNRWTKSELRFYVNGKIISSVDMAWPISTSDSFDRCVIGGSFDQREDNLFSGRIASIIGFTEALLPQQISGLYSLGPNYSGQLKFESGVRGILNETERKALIESKLSASIMFSYHPSACDHNLCLDQSPKPNSVFAHAPHALMQGKVKAVRTTSLQSALQSLGGIQLLYLLLEQLDYNFEDAIESGATMEPFPVSALLFNLLFDLARTSYVLRAQLARTAGLVVFSQALRDSPSGRHLSDSLLSGLLEASRYLICELLVASRNSPAASTLLALFRQLFDKLLFAHGMWLRANIKVQDRLYAFLADEFRVDLLGRSGRSIVASALHAIKYYFWIVRPAEPFLESTPDERPPLDYLARIRSNLLLFIKPLILQQYQFSPTATGNPSSSQGEEVDSLFNFLSTVKEPDNLRDVLFFTVALMEKHPAMMIPWFDRHEGIQCVFQLLGLSDDDCRLYALKMLGFFLKYSKPKRKQEAITQHSVFSHLCDRFLTVAPVFTMKAYNVFFELLTEDVSLKLTDKILPNPSPTHRIENSALLKSIALLIIHSKRTPEVMVVRQAFLEHLLALCLNSDANRRSVLQMSVWQDWVIGLASLFPQNEQNSYATATVMEILRCLLFYALRFEFGGWRVWIDTLAILHSRISFEEFRRASQQQRHSLNARNDNQTPPTHFTNYPSRQPSQPGTTSATLDPSIPQGEAVKDIDLTDRVIHKLVNEMLDQVVTHADGSKQKSEGEAKNETNIVNTSDDSTEPGHDKVDCQEESQAKMDPIKQSMPNQQEALQQQQGPSNHESERVGVEGFRTPPFVWSYLHQILLDSILRSIEDEFHAIATITSSKEKLEAELPSSNSVDADEYDMAGSIAVAQLQAFINDPANQIYAINLIHLISQLSDSLVTACGGLLPLLAAATSPTMELEIQEPSSGLLLETAFGFLLRVANIADVVVFMPAASINLSTLEKETGMNAGGIIRQCLRLACLCAVRNCLESRLLDFLPTPEVLSQIHTLPTPHHHFAYSLSPLQDNETELRPRASPSTSSTSTPTTDLADSSLSSIDKGHSKSRFLSGFHFYNLLRNKTELIQRLANPAASNAGLTTKHLSPDCIAYLERLRNLPRNLQHLALGLRPSMASYPSGYMGGIFDKTVGNPLQNIESLLQNADLNRLHNVIYRDEDETRQVQFVALAVLYFLSVLMVSKYRDLLDPVNLLTVCRREAAVTDQSPQPPVSPAAWRLGSSSSDNAIVSANSPEGLQENAASKSEDPESECGPVSNQSDHTEANRTEAVQSDEPSSLKAEEKENLEVQKPPQNGSEKGSSVEEKGSEDEDSVEPIDVSNVNQVQVATIHQSVPKTTLPISLATGKPTVCSVIASTSGASEVSNKVSSESSPPPTPHLLPSPPTSTKSASADLTDLLEHSLGSSVPLLKEIFFDFEGFLGKTLIGSHGQDLLFTGGLNALRNSSLAVEIVMLLCSQEWQNSLQKHAGLAFIELVNECRLLAKASREHFISVAHEADFILAKIRSLEIRRQNGFRAAALRRQRRRVDELDILQTRRLEAAGARDSILATQCVALTHHILQCLQQAPLSSQVNRNDASPAVNTSALVKQTTLFLERTKRPPVRFFYRLDTWEDDSRQRRRLVLNPFGSNHPEAVLHSPPPISLAQPPNKAHTVTIDATALNLKSQSEPLQQQPSQDSETTEVERKSSVELQPLQPPQTPLNPNSPLVLTEPALTPGLVSMHQDSLAYGQLEIGPLSSTVVTTPCQLIAAGVAVHGILSVSNSVFAFETDPSHEENQKIDPQVLAYTGNLYSKWHFGEIRAVFTRRHLLRYVALEIFLTTRTSVMFALPDEAIVRRVIYALPPVGIGIRYGVPQSHRISLASGRQHLSLSQATQRWQRREMSNFDYLMCLNTLAGRSFNDLNQYPIFPWVLSNYTSKHLDLNEPANYRDLSKPVGALSPARKAFFDERYADWDDPTQPAFHYGTHYSTAAFVLNYLIRLEPFTTMFLNMQGGKFDHPNRLFYSVAATWSGCLESSTNVKELIPEFFYLPEMFENTNGYDLGTLDDGTKLGDVELPPWASSPEEFVRMHRQALESDLVSCQLHHWIDLIFGYKQRGPEAVKAVNVFHYLTYEGSVNWNKVTDPVMREALEGQIACFGQTPSQLLVTPHPPRGSALAACPRLFVLPTHEVAARLRLTSRAPLLGLYFVCHTNEVELIGVSANCVFTVNKWNGAAAAKTSRHKSSKVTSPITKSQNVELTEASLEMDAETSSGQPITQPYAPSSNFPTSATLPVSLPESHSMPLLTLDPTPLASNVIGNRRYVGENMDPSVRLSVNNFVVTADGRAIVACGYCDYSFRIFAVSSGQCMQSVIGGHQDVVTCLGHSESNATGHCYLASGGRDGLICLWILNTKTLALFSESPGAMPRPHVTLFGHQNFLQCIALSAELGLVFSGSEGGVCLLHTTQGELLRRFEMPQTTADRLRPCSVFSGVSAAVFAAGFGGSPMRVLASRHGYVIFQLGAAKIAVFTLNARLVAVTDLYRQIQGGNDTSVNQTPGSQASSSSSSNASPLVVSPNQTRATTDSSAIEEDGSYAITTLAVTRCANFICVGGNDGLVSILHLHSLRLLHSLPRCKAPITSLQLSPDKKYIVVGLHNGGLVVFNVNFNCWREKILNGEGFKDQKPKLSLQKPISQAVAEERKEMAPSSNSPNPLANTEEDGSNDTTVHVEAVEQADIKSSEVDVSKIREDETVPDVSN